MQVQEHKLLALQPTNQTLKKPLEIRKDSHNEPANNTVHSEIVTLELLAAFKKKKESELKPESFSLNDENTFFHVGKRGKPCRELRLMLSAQIVNRQQLYHEGF